jgi:hypothetical protein
MQATVQNFRGIVEARIDIAPIALIAGANGAGKTSIARAVAAAITGQAIPFEGVLKKDAAIMTRSHGGVAEVSAGEEDGWCASVIWPKCETYSEGAPPRVSAIAAGLAHPLDLPAKERNAFLIKLLDALPSREDFASALKSAGVQSQAIEEYWGAIGLHGWDAACDQAKKTCQKSKGAWEQITGEKYGSQKAAVWRPTGWMQALEGHTEVALEENVANARKALEEAIGAQALSHAERGRLQDEVNKIEGLSLLIEDAKLDKDAIDAKISDIKTKIQARPDPRAQQTQPCPHCQEPVAVDFPTTGVGGKQGFLLVKPVHVDAKDAKKASLEYASLCGDLARLEVEALSKQKHFDDLCRKFKEAGEAANKLDACVPLETDGQMSSTEFARRRLASAELELDMVGRRAKADERQRQIVRNQAVIDALDSNGLRRSKLALVIGRFSEERLAPLCRTFGVKPLVFDDGLAIRIGETPYIMLSASEQFRIRVILQIAIAQMQGDGLLIIDGADILDTAGRGALLSAVAGSRIPAIICMTLPRPDAAPPLARANAGRNYWVECGTAREYEPQKQERKAA